MNGRAGANLAPHLVIVAPFWGASAHVGVYRVDRFVRWARERGARVTIIQAGSVDRVEQTDAGDTVVVVADPIRFYRDALPAAAGPVHPRRENGLRRAIATTVLSPDPGIVWARHAARHPSVLAHARGARWVLSSSPPESPHVCAWRIARAVGAQLVADFRDGWLDDPLKPALHRYRVRRWHEARWERRVVRDATHVFVTSTVWRDMLVARYPNAAARVVVLTNGYPAATPVPAATDDAPTRRSGRTAGSNGRLQRPTRDDGRPLTLLHAGRFTTSRRTQTVPRLLEPLLAGLRHARHTGRVRLLGDLGPEDVRAVDALRPAFAAAGWSLELLDRVPRADALAAVASADGLLLLSATPPTIPSKLFEYLPTGRPVFAVTPRDSAVWRACAELPQVTLAASDEPASAPDAVERFLDQCAHGPVTFAAPAAFGEAALAEVFAATLGLGGETTAGERSTVEAVPSAVAQR